MKKKKVFLSLFVLLAIVVLAAFLTLNPSPASISKTEIETTVSASGNKCSYTVGCSCSGFKPKTNGKEWEKSYCKQCGHHKKYHKS